MKVPGMCAVCGKAAFEVLKTWPDGHPFAGEPRELGRPIKQAKRVTLTLMDGSNTAVTVHEACLPSVVESLPKIWHDINLRYTAERKAHLALNQKDFNEAQHRKADEVQLHFIHNRPLGVLAIEDWSNG